MQKVILELTEQVIRDIIAKCYNKCYIGKIQIKKFGQGYDVALYLNADYQAIHIAADIDKKNYLKFFEEEIRKRHLGDIYFYTGYQTNIYEPHQAVPIDHSCNSNDTRKINRKDGCSNS